MSAAEEVSIDDLWTTARASIAVERKAAERKVVRKITDEPKALSTQQLFADMSNYSRVCGVALIHEETETVLGNFSEYKHNTVAGCRKLLREESSISITRTERVSGSWWLGTERTPEPRKEWHEKRSAIIHLHLDKLGVHAPATEVVVHLSYGSVARVELAVETQLAAEVESDPTMLWLPARTNVLEVMSRDCKIALRMEIH